jgi:hypothetical protein
VRASQSFDVDIRGNRIVDGGERALSLGGTTGDQYFRPRLSREIDNAEARDIRVVANVIEGGTAAVAFVGCVGCLVANNTIVNPARWVFRILQETVSHRGFTVLPASQGRIVNNLIVARRAALEAEVNVGRRTAPETFRFERNLWFAVDRPSGWRPTLPGEAIDNLVGLDPRLDLEFGIDAASPAASAGLALPEVRGDFNGDCYAPAPAVGAFVPKTREPRQAGLTPEPRSRRAFSIHHLSRSSKARTGPLRSGRTSRR